MDCVDSELAIGQCRLGVPGNSSLNYLGAQTADIVKLGWKSQQTSLCDHSWGQQDETKKIHFLTVTSGRLAE